MARGARGEYGCERQLARPRRGYTNAHDADVAPACKGYPTSVWLAGPSSARSQSGAERPKGEEGWTQPGHEQRCTEPNSDIHSADRHSIRNRLLPADAFTRANTGAERGADQTSIASCAAGRLAPARRAQCPEHRTPAPSYIRSSPRTPPTSTLNP